MSQPKTTAPTVRVHANPDASLTECELRIAVSLPKAPDLAARAAALGLPALRADLTDACRAERAVEKYRVLGDQVRAAENRVSDAERAFKRVQAAKTLLETEPVGDLANRLRAVEAELGAAEADKAAAERDLAVIRHLVPKLWPAAANAIALACSAPMGQRLLALGAEQDAATAKLNEAAEILRQAIERAAAHLAPVADELLAVSRAYLECMGDSGAMVQQIRAEILGPVPAGVTTNGRNWFEEVKAAPVPAEPPVVAPPAPTIGTVTFFGSSRP